MEYVLSLINLQNASDSKGGPFIRIIRFCYLDYMETTIFVHYDKYFETLQRPLKVWRYFGYIWGFGEGDPFNSYDLLTSVIVLQSKGVVYRLFTPLHNEDQNLTELFF